MFSSDSRFIQSSAASCGPLKVNNSNYGDGKQTGVTGDLFSVTCADGYFGPERIVICTGAAAGVSRWMGMPTCEGAYINPVTRIGNVIVCSQTGCSDIVLMFAHDSNSSFDMRCPYMTNDAPIPLVTAATCPSLTVDHGKISSQKTNETVNITCDAGYTQVGTGATCSPAGPGKAAWTNIPTCEGRLDDWLFKRTWSFARIYRCA